ncbi:dihydrofolate reductase-like [Heracleum sosnowskyi]|uniref:Dihydrofolate reductase-like n=1 Tax=Heracleum sosnowskyi TaxID=360622 RepID=A0AAD8N185_9APIA|nr:dihydrofolate reductase-like [Heracleum sosnowskyi]
MKDRAEKKFKVLCLHGYGCSGAYLKMRLQVWPSNVLESMDFVFIDAPFPTHSKPFPAFSWFSDSPELTDAIGPFCTSDRTFNESMSLIEETMVKFGPFDGVLGFSQGAYIAAALPGMQAQGMVLSKVEAIKFVVVISGGKLGGFKFPAPTLAKNAFSSPIEIPSLHCFGENDSFAKLPAIELLGSFVDPFVIFHSGGHEVPKLDERRVEGDDKFSQ